MAQSTATILIPDISGFTEFITTTELSHGSFAINMLIDAMVQAVGDEYEVSEIEGDALLLIRKGVAPSRKEVQDTCMKIFNAFHFRRKWMQQHAVCPCGACLAISGLTLKFVAHHGQVAEIKVGRFVKQSGTEMIVAHRLLKNKINNHEYLLVTDKLPGQPDSSAASNMAWTSSSEEYPAIGKIDFRYALLGEERKNCPEPPPLEEYYSDDSPYAERTIAAPFRDVYMVMMNIPGRPEWMPDLVKVEQDMPQVFVGSIHYCTFKSFQAVVSPLRMNLSTDRILYAESCHLEELGLNLIYEYIFSRVDDKTSLFSWRLMNEEGLTASNEIFKMLREQMWQKADRLAECCVKIQGSAFNPAFQHV